MQFNDLRQGALVKFVEGALVKYEKRAVKSELHGQIGFVIDPRCHHIAVSGWYAKVHFPGAPRWPTRTIAWRHLEKVGS